MQNNIKVGQIYEWTKLNARFAIHDVRYAEKVMDGYMIKTPFTITCTGNNGYNYMFSSNLVNEWWFIKEYPTYHEAINSDEFKEQSYDI